MKEVFSHLQVPEKRLIICLWLIRKNRIGVRFFYGIPQFLFIVSAQPCLLVENTEAELIAYISVDQQAAFLSENVHYVSGTLTFPGQVGFFIFCNAVMILIMIP